MRPGEIDVRALKEKALEFFKKGKFARSAETWSEICKADPKDNQSRLRCGDALTKAGQQANAYEAYRLAAEGFAKQGFLPQAVAAAKLALTLSPDDEAVKKLLADFHAERFGSRPSSTPGSGAVDAVQAAVLDAAVASAPPDVAAPMLSAPRPVRILARRPSGILNPAEVAVAEAAVDAHVLDAEPPPALQQPEAFESAAPQRASRVSEAQLAPVEVPTGPSEETPAAPKRSSRIIAAQPASHEAGTFDSDSAHQASTPQAVPLDPSDAAPSATKRPARIIVPQAGPSPTSHGAETFDAPLRPSRVIAVPPATREAPADMSHTTPSASPGLEAFEAPQRPSRVIAAPPATREAPADTSHTTPSASPGLEVQRPSRVITVPPPTREAPADTADSTPSAPKRPSRIIAPQAVVPPAPPSPLNTPPPRRSSGAASAQVPPAPPLSTPPSAHQPTGQLAPEVQAPLSTPPGPRGDQFEPLSTPPAPQRSRTSAPSSGAALAGQPPESPRGTPPQGGRVAVAEARSTPPPARPPPEEVAPPLSTPPLPHSARAVSTARPSTPSGTSPRARQPVAGDAAPTPPPPTRASRVDHDASPTPLPAPRRAKSTPPVGTQPSPARSADHAAATPPPARRPSSASGGGDAAPTPPPAATAAPNQGVENVTVPFDPAMIAELRSRIRTSDATVVAMSPLPAEEPPAVLPPNDVGDGEYLARVPLFAELTSEAFSTLLQAAPMVRLAAGEVAVEQHALGDSMFAILSGRVRVFRDEPTGRRELAILEAGGVFGEMSLVTGANRSAWVVAEVDDTTLLQVSKLLLVELSSSSPSIARALASLAQRRILANLMATEPIFSGLKRNERLELIERFEVKEVARGQVLVGPSSELGGLFVLTSGELEAVDNRGAVALSPVVLLGDAALLGSEVLTHFMATTRSQVLHLPADHALRLTKHPTVAARRTELLDAALRRLQG